MNSAPGEGAEEGRSGSLAASGKQSAADAQLRLAGNDSALIVRPAHFQSPGVSCDKGEFNVRVLGNRCFRLPVEQGLAVKGGLEFVDDVARHNLAFFAQAQAAFHAVLDQGA